MPLQTNVLIEGYPSTFLINEKGRQGVQQAKRKISQSFN